MKIKQNLLLALIVIVAMTSCKKDANIKLETCKVETTTISEIVTATGTMESVTQVDVGTQVTGIVDKLYADFNDNVKKGQLLAEIEKTTLQSDLTSATASMESAKASYEYALRNYERDKALHAEKLISDYEFQTSEKEYKVAKNAYEKSKADRVRAAKNLNYAEIYSPIDGIIISREVEVGQTVVSSMNVANMFVIADLENMQVVGNVDEADIGKVKLGQRVTFTVDAYPEDVFDGQVSQVRLNPKTESNVVTYEVIVAASNPDLKLIPGMTANLTIYTMELKDVTALPMKAFKFEPKEYPEELGLPKPKPFVSGKSDKDKYVWVVRGDELVQTEIETGVSNGIYQQILSGIKVGDIVAMGYEEEMMPNGAQQEENPFLPKPPGSSKKK